MGTLIIQKISGIINELKVIKFRLTCDTPGVYIEWRLEWNNSTGKVDAMDRLDPLQKAIKTTINKPETYCARSAELGFIRLGSTSKKIPSGVDLCFLVRGI